MSSAFLAARPCQKSSNWLKFQSEREAVPDVQARLSCRSNPENLPKMNTEVHPSLTVPTMTDSIPTIALIRPLVSFHRLRHPTTSLLKQVGASDAAACDPNGHEFVVGSAEYTRMLAASELAAGATANAGDSKRPEQS